MFCHYTGQDYQGCAVVRDRSFKSGPVIREGWFAACGCTSASAGKQWNGPGL